MKFIRGADVIGGVALASYAAHAALSWFLAAGVGTAPRAALARRRWFEALAAGLPGAPAWLREALGHGGPFREWGWLALTYSLPLMVQTLCFVLVIGLIHRSGEADLDNAHAAARLKRWATAFAVVSVAAFNVMTPDIWLAIPWGRMVLAGLDPYLAPFPRELAADIPLDIAPMRMTYGPLWAAISAGAVLVTAGRPLLAWLLIKVILLAAWLGGLSLVYRMAEPLGARRQATAMAVLGWLPIGVHSVVAEGHNDGMMVLFLLLWMAGLAATSGKAPLSFVASVLTKLAVAPAAIVDPFYHWLTRSMSLRRYLLRVLPAAIVGLAGAAFLLSGHRLEEAGMMRDWRFLEPFDLLLALQGFLGVPIPFKSWLPRIAFGAVAVWALRDLARSPHVEKAWMATFAILAAVLFSGVGHIWPWFYVWVLPFVALLPSHLLSRFVLGAALLAPFSILEVWHIPYLGDGNSIPESLAIYGTAFALTGASVWARRYR